MHNPHILFKMHICFGWVAILLLSCCHFLGDQHYSLEFAKEAMSDRLLEQPDPVGAAKRLLDKKGAKKGRAPSTAGGGARMYSRSSLSTHFSWLSKLMSPAWPMARPEAWPEPWPWSLPSFHV